MSINRFVLVALVIFVCGCSSVKTYDGPERPRSNIAILERFSPAVINNIDGKFRGIGDLDTHEFLPGPHVLKVHFVKGDRSGLHYSPDPVTLSFTAEAGASYKLIAKADEEMKRWIAVITEENTGNIVSKVISQ